jgi:hypothetical protein
VCEELKIWLAQSASTSFFRSGLSFGLVLLLLMTVHDFYEEGLDIFEIIWT